MSEPSIEDILKLSELQLGKRGINASDRFLEDLGAESADLANLVAAVEEKYDIAVKESAIAGIRTPAELLEIVQKHLV